MAARPKPTATPPPTPVPTTPPAAALAPHWPPYRRPRPLRHPADSNAKGRAAPDRAA